MHLKNSKGTTAPTAADNNVGSGDFVASVIYGSETFQQAIVIDGPPPYLRSAQRNFIRQLIQYQEKIRITSNKVAASPVPPGEIR
jgi:hypothetical protein